MIAVRWAVLVCAVAGSSAAGLRWLRVAQREHYLPGSVTRFAIRWWRSTPADSFVIAAAFLAALASIWSTPLALLPAAGAAFAPIKLGIRGRTSKLAWTRRLRTLGGVTFLLAAAAVLVGALLGGIHGAATAAGMVAIGAPLILDAALAAVMPLERRLARRYVAQATDALRRVAPTVVAITGSYGKTTTKGYVAHLIGAERDVLASPASYNNQAGLARTVNEHLRPGVQVLVAEMGTYGRGEIAALCEWMTPEISVITAIGPAHLERFKSLETTLEAKSEITTRARNVVLNVDDPRLARLADDLLVAGKQVTKASGRDPRTDVAVVEAPGGLELRVAGRRIGVAPTGDRPTSLSNAACAVAVALIIGLPPEVVVPRLANLPVPPNRLQRYTAELGYVVLDDTFNSNPAGARLALERLGREGQGRRVLVTPGMVELGCTQPDENAAFGEAAAKVCSDVVVVARTNRKALTAGVSRGDPTTNVVVVDRLDEAVAWARSSLGPGDAILYENDLPDHFP